MCNRFNNINEIAVSLNISRNKLNKEISSRVGSISLKKIQSIARRVDLDSFNCSLFHQLFLNGQLSNNQITDQLIENFIPNSDQFDFSFIPYLKETNRSSIIQKNVQISNLLSIDTALNEQTTNYIHRINSFPDLIVNLNPEIKFKYNNVLSICFLYGQLVHPVEGISSPHLKGEFTASLRKEGTGFLALNLSSCPLNEEEKTQCLEIFNWLKRNNYLYKDIDENSLEINHREYISRIDPTQRPQGDSVTGVILNDAQNLIDAKTRKVGIKIKNGNEFNYVYVPLEKALAMMFPMLYPDGYVPIIPNASLRKQARYLLSIHPSLRCGRLGCFLLLYLYNIVLFSETQFYNRNIITQRIQMPAGIDRNFNEIIARPDDPAFPEYWLHKQNELNAMIEVYGVPDLMITLTFNNHWPEVHEIRQNIANTLNSNISNYDLNVCPIESIMIWRSHFKKLSRNGFNDITKKMGLGKTKYYMWRLEFQARGAPHVHALIWLEHSISIRNIHYHFSATIPPLWCHITKNYIQLLWKT